MLIEFDARSRAVLPGHKNKRFLMHENSDGSIFLEPAVVVSAAQLQYDQTPRLQEILSDAAASDTVTRRRRQR